MHLKPSLLLAALLSLPALAQAQGRILEPLVPDEVLEQLHRQYDDGQPLLPRHASAWERELEAQMRWEAPDIDEILARMPSAERLDTPPEYALNKAILMRWVGNALQTSITVEVTQRDERAQIWMFVRTQTEENSVRTTLSTAGANLDRVRFFLQNCTVNSNCSIWARDYGPRFINADQEWAIIDHTYDRPTRTQDNALPGVVAAELGVPIHLLPLRQGGGNYHSFGNGEAFVTTHILTENPSVSAAQVEQLFAAYQGVDLSLTPEFPQSFDSTRHIDMWMLPVDDQTVIIGEYPDTGGIYAQPRQVTESVAAELRGRGYTVLRTPGRNIGGVHYTYTNSVIVNDIVLVCQFFNNPTISALNADALAVFAQAFPSKDIIPINCSGIISASGAAHCIVKHVPFPDRIRRANFD